MGYLLGVDLGTTFTAAAVASGGEPSMVGLGNRALQVPSVLFYSDDGFVVGEAAERRGLIEPGRVAREFKRRLGDHVPVLVAGSPFSADALMAELLSWVVAQVTARMGEAPAGIVLTHPASWGPFKLDALQQVAVLADVGPTQWCAEPAAAAAQYAARAQLSVGDRLAVYDLGGGTFDVCVLQKTADGFVMLGPPEGVEHLGGADFDEALFQLVLRGLGDQLAGSDPDDPQGITGLARLRRDCVEAKEALSSEVEVDVPITLPGVGTSVRVTRGEFEALIRPTLQQTVQALTRAVRSAGLTPDQLTGIVLVGGSSRIPLVGELLQQEFGVPTAMDTHPKHDIALGAVRLIQDRGPAAEGGGVAARPTPMPILKPGAPELGRPSGTSAPAPTPSPAVAAAVPPQTAPPASPPPASPPPASPPPAWPRPLAAAAPPVAPVPPPDGPATAAPRPTPAPAGTAPPVAAAPAGAASESLALGGSRPAATRRVSPKVLIAAGLGLAVIAGGVGVGLALAGRDDPTGPALTADNTPVVIPTAPAPTPETPKTAGPVPTEAALPRSAPLTDTQLVVPMKIKNNWDLYLADTTTKEPGRRLTTSSAWDTFPSLSPDRQSVVYVRRSDKDGTGSLRVVATNGQGDRSLFPAVPAPCAKSVSRPAWNPQTPTLMALPCVDASGTMGLYLVRTTGEIVHRIDLAGNKTVGDPSFSPDGRTLVFWASPNDTYDGGTLMTAPADGSGQAKRLLTSTMSGQDADPAWSPDGATIAFRRRAGTAAKRLDLNVWRVAVADPTGLKQLTSTSSDEQDPSWSPDGSRIAFKSARRSDAFPDQRVPRIWSMAADGSDERLLWSKGSTGEQTAAAWARR